MLFGINMLIKQPKASLLLFTILVLNYFVGTVISYFVINTIYANTGNYVSLIVFNTLLSILIGALVLLIISRMLLNMIDAREFDIKNLISTRLFTNLFLYNIIFLMLVSIGFILLIVPGVILFIKFLPGLYLIVDEDLGVFEAMNKSWSINAGYKGKIFLPLLLLIAIYSIARIILNIFSLLFPTIIIETLSKIAILTFSLISFYAMFILYRDILGEWQPSKLSIEDMKDNALNYIFNYLKKYYFNSNDNNNIRFNF